MSEPGLRRLRVLVTGATGFIGAHVVRRLVEAGAAVHALVRPGSLSRRLDDVAGDVARWEGDVTDVSTVLACYRETRPRIVIHLAADTSVRRYDHGWDDVERSVEVNLRGTLNVLRGVVEAGGAVSTFVRLGGLEEYGTAPVPFEESARERPVSPYSASQVAATQYCQMLQPRTAVAVITLRPALVYGPWQSTNFFIPALIEACLSGDDFEIKGGTQRRDLLYVDDLVEAILLAACRPDLRGRVVNLGHGVEHRMRDVADEVVRLMDSPSRLRIGEASVEPTAGLAHLVTSTSLATALLGWRPRVGLLEGLARTIAWSRTRRVSTPSPANAARGGIGA